MNYIIQPIGDADPPSCSGHLMAALPKKRFFYLCVSRWHSLWPSNIGASSPPNRWALASDTDEGKAKLSKDRCLNPKISSWREDIPFRAHCSVHRPRGRKWAGVGFAHTLERAASNPTGPSGCSVTHPTMSPFGSPRSPDAYAETLHASHPRDSSSQVAVGPRVPSGHRYDRRQPLRNRQPGRQRLDAGRASGMQ